MKPSRYSIIFARGFLLLLVTLLLPTSEASYHIQVVDIGAAACNSDVIAGALLGIRWSIDNSSAADGDQCGLAIRSMLNTVDDDAYVVYKHHNNVVQWSCPFQIHPEGWQPPLSTSERLAEQANNISQLTTKLAYQANSTNRDIGIVGIVCGLVGALAAAGISYCIDRRRGKKQPMLPIAEPASTATSSAAQSAKSSNTPEVGTPVRPASPV
ncbi:hypothetical protein D6C97_03306 [Aureobasidium pullulans]|nr:hypothetical protein D6C97_03306 [Aureobasidium pullulans]